MVMVLLNPSTADAHCDDPTLRRCRAFARSWGYAEMRLLNLYAYRATDPRELWRTPDPVGPDNDRHLATAGANGLVVAAWGALARPDRVRQVLALPGFHRLAALGVTKTGSPRHPLYLPADTRPEPWRPATANA